MLLYFRLNEIYFQRLRRVFSSQISQDPEVLKEQAGLVIVHGPDGSLTAVAKPQNSVH